MGTRSRRLLPSRASRVQLWGLINSNQITSACLLIRASAGRAEAKDRSGLRSASPSPSPPRDNRTIRAPQMACTAMMAAITGRLVPITTPNQPNTAEQRPVPNPSEQLQSHKPNVWGTFGRQSNSTLLLSGLLV